MTVKVNISSAAGVAFWLRIRVGKTLHFVTRLMCAKKLRSTFSSTLTYLATISELFEQFILGVARHMQIFVSSAQSLYGYVA